MNTIDSSQLLAQLRLATAQAKGAGVLPAADASAGTAGASFSSVLKQSIDTVNGMQQTAGELKQSFELGTAGVGLSDVMLATSKAQLGFQAMVQVRNKVVEAYQEIMRMPV
ncbi:MAG: flagellar hook-basal body complex protein FliE [Hydrogenophaga sp.]|nr:flagellar hook-basal body complex protein FliE [Gammaproteobacteria bacterium]